MRVACATVATGCRQVLGLDAFANTSLHDSGPPSTLVARYPLAAVGNGVVVDQLGHYNLSCTKCPIVPAHVGLEFDDSDSASTSGLIVPAPATLTAWVEYTQRPDAYSIVLSTETFTFRINSSLQPQPMISGAMDTSVNALTLGQWANIAFVLTSDEVIFYLDGQLQFQATLQQANQLIGLTLGNSTNSKGPVSIDYTRVFSRALSSQDLDDFYTQGMGN